MKISSNTLPKGPLIKSLESFGIVHVDVPIRQYSRWKIGGNADVVIVPNSANDLSKLLKFTSENNLRHILIGSTTNLLFDDNGIEALVILLGYQMNKIHFSGNRVTAQCGIWVPRFAKQVADAGLSGAEHMSGIPGTLGGLICMNGGSQRKGVGDHIVSVQTVSPEGKFESWARKDCGFAYRTSIFQDNGHAIVEAEFEFPTAKDKRATKQSMLSILRDRRLKFPQKIPNCGSVFVSNPDMYSDYGPPGAVIERCGLKGLERGKAQISPLHANFIVNNGGASSNDVLFLIHKVRAEVYRNTGYLMPAEARYISTAGNIVPAHEKAEELFGKIG